ncbi:radical SAM family heme chaperone HemW [Flavisolibacter ginsenosidimutans]|uniref:Heme chaperone HemW n=1 Tax=Flavisolibacter ginsenosidimutans TaxID=661481 RepID=A0A5B8UNW5_9BACT|nr:radical SAM family heme chaperone HemW [Flavisolibacter ginsenosidimutans]QEC57750.1 radical SAM family heme chaperone HemW [Flavisolibacter ginsenosidimutans]
MAGIYLHIPFCKQACTYCNFHFATSLRYKDDLIAAMRKEIVAEKEYLKGESVNTIYFGGGTPSLLPIADCRLLIADLLENYPVAADAEITLEANPDDISTGKLKAWKTLGINRLSIGVQSFFEEELRWMNRAHNAQQAIGNLQLARSEFDNITMDLIYGSPLLTDGMWMQNVQRAVGLNIPHLSCYALTVEEKTPLHKNISLHKTVDVDSDKQARQFLLLMQWLRTAGYEHYEVSNFAKPGFRSRHNSSYWKGTPYLGIGPSAHSFNGMERRWNVANNSAYIKGTSEGIPQRETEVLSSTQQLNETLMISLRTMEGIDLNKIQTTWGENERKRIENDLKRYVSNGLVKINNAHAQLTDEGMLRADGIASDLFV